MLYNYAFRVQTERLDSAMVRSTDAARWPLRDDFEDLAPLRHIMEDLSSEKDILHLSQPMVVLYGCFHLSESMLARRL